MPSFSLPWVVGPVPIVVTIWSAFTTAAALVRRREMTGGRFASAFLFPLGAIAAVSLTFLPRYDLRVVSVAGQLTTTLFFIAIYIAEKTRRGDPLLAPMEEQINLRNMFWTLYFIIIIYITYVIIIFSFPISEACSIGRCYILELLFGGKIYSFSVLYFVNSVGSMFLSCIIVIISRIIATMRMRS
ncbi:magnesium-transporting ATPase (P-type) [Rhizobium sp. BK650]|nr:magnesium-transporting ATPase (P-type) [Rhizobium sp. BK650]